MKVLVSDNLGEIGIQMFQEEEGIEVDVNTGLEPGELKSIIGDYDALVIRSATGVNAAPRLLLHAYRLGLIHPETGKRVAFFAPCPFFEAEF